MERGVDQGERNLNSDETCQRGRCAYAPFSLRKNWQMRILFISHHFFPAVGGIEVNSEILAEVFHKAGHVVRLVTWSEDPAGKSFSYPIIRNPGILTLLAEHKRADVVFENNPSLRLSWPAVLFKRPTVIALNTWVARVDGTLNWQDKLKYTWLNRAKAVIAVSEALRRRCCESAVVIGNPYRQEIFRKLPGVERDLHFAFVGRLVSDKGVDLAIRALHSLLDREGNTESGDAYRLTVIGDGPERGALEALASTLNIRERVDFKGILRGDALVSCLNQHQFLLVPSAWEEPFGNVALEGMACGCVPIVSDGGGLPDAVGDAGITFKRNDLNDLIAKLNSVLENNELRNELIQRAEKHLQKHHPVQVGEKYLKVIESALNY